MSQTALEIAAEELRSGGLRPADVQASLQQQEEGTIYAQILHFINLIINFRVPLNAAAPILEEGINGVPLSPSGAAGGANTAGGTPTFGCAPVSGFGGGGSSGGQGLPNGLTLNGGHGALNAHHEGRREFAR